METTINDVEGASRISVRKKHRKPVKIAILGESTKKIDPYAMSKIQETMYLAVTKGVWAIPKTTKLTDEAREILHKKHDEARRFIDGLKLQHADKWLAASSLIDDLYRYGVLSPEDSNIDWRKRRNQIPSLDLVEHLGFNKNELIDMLIKNKFLPENFWDL